MIRPPSVIAIAGMISLRWLADSLKSSRAYSISPNISQSFSDEISSGSSESRGSLLIAIFSTISK